MESGKFGIIFRWPALGLEPKNLLMGFRRNFLRKTRILMFTSQLSHCDGKPLSHHIGSWNRSVSRVVLEALSPFWSQILIFLSSGW